MFQNAIQIYPKKSYTHSNRYLTQIYLFSQVNSQEDSKIKCPKPSVDYLGFTRHPISWVRHFLLRFEYSVVVYVCLVLASFDFLPLFGRYMFDFFIFCLVESSLIRDQDRVPCESSFTSHVLRTLSDNPNPLGPMTRFPRSVRQSQGQQNLRSVQGHPLLQHFCALGFKHWHKGTLPAPLHPNLNFFLYLSGAKAPSNCPCAKT